MPFQPPVLALWRTKGGVGDELTGECGRRTGAMWGRFEWDVVADFGTNQCLALVSNGRSMARLGLSNRWRELLLVA